LGVVSKPHLPHVAPQRFFDMYDEDTISLPEPPTIPTAFPKEMWFACEQSLSPAAALGKLRVCSRLAA